jgi:uridine phosphorylase
MVFFDSDGKLHHIRVGRGDLPPRVLLPGSRSRVKLIQRFLENSKVMADERQLVVVGSYRGVDVAAVDTGMGPSSAAIVVREVIEALDYSKGYAVLIRPGTSGSLQREVRAGDLVISTGVIAQECVSKKIIGDGFPLIPDQDVVNALRNACLELGVRFHMGLTHSKDALYEVEEPEASINPDEARKNLEYLRNIGVLCTEMELSVILALASRYKLSGRKIKAGGIFLVISEDMKGEDILVKVALRALASL